VYKAPYDLMRKTWKELDYSNEENYSSKNFYMMKLGTFFVHTPKIKRINGKDRNDEQVEQSSA